jgi:hypothetical protein
MTDSPGLARSREVAALRAEVERLRTAIETHKERWTSVNGGDLKQNAYPKDLELWAVLESSTDVAV